MDQKTLARECIAAAEEFYARRLWKEFLPAHLFHLQLPDGESFLAFLISPDLDREFQEPGIMFVQGDKAVQELRRRAAKGTADLGTQDEREKVAEDQEAEEEAEETSDVGLRLNLIQGERELLHEGYLKVANAAGYNRRKVPCFIALEDGRNARPMRNQELKTMLFLLRGLLLAHKRRQLEGLDLQHLHRLPRVRISGSLRHPQVEVDLVCTDETGMVEVPRIPIPPEVADLPRREMRCLVGLPMIRIPNVERKQPGAGGQDQKEDVVEDAICHTLLVVDETCAAEPELELITQTTAGPNLQEAADFLFGIFTAPDKLGPKGLPQEIHFASLAMYHVLAGGLSELGVRCSYAVDQDRLEQVLRNAKGRKDLAEDPSATTTTTTTTALPETAKLTDSSQLSPGDAEG